MKLGPFFEAIGPYLHGAQPHASAVHALYGRSGGESVDARRLAIYGEFCRAHRFQAVDGVHAATREAVVEHAGARAWEQLVEGYFAVHPMTHVELNENGAELARFLAEDGAECVPGLPGWISELAELEWWEWCTQNAPDDPADAEPTGPLRLASTVELRAFTHDLVPWLARRTSAAPEARDVVVLFWRDAQQRYRRENASPLEMWILKALLEGSALDALVTQGAVTRAQWQETLQDLRDAGIVLGAP